MANHYTQYVSYHVGLLQQFKAAVDPYPPFSYVDADQTDAPQLTEDDQEFINTLDHLCELEAYDETANHQGQWLVARIISAYSHLTHLLPRDILWFFGGDCLHYMPDEEITFYQQLDELRFAAEESDGDFDYGKAKENLTKAH